MKRQPGDVHPSEYDWKDQFDVRGMGYIKFDAGKVRGLAQYAEELEARVAELDAKEAAREIAADADTRVALAGKDDSCAMYRCTVCGRVGAVGRCCGDETRERISA